ncbi:chlorophyll a/b-binding protein [Chaetoceros tenuissimus]|uniref:Chlorophyll a/b-binding protein n=1 Tax=Chaetoceros tenuissimus TaxID=426638 RepID=A0AAD3CXB9_9STRA|nr:chlorophyll a/b-binding protein [Chaetoceros tenuissimus]
MKTAILATLVASAAAFAPSQVAKTSTALNALTDMPGSTAPVGPFDPMNLAESGSEETLAWFRAAELKHSRVAMLATTGYLVQGAGIHFPGMLSSDVSFADLSAMKPLEAWDAVPDAGKAQILATIFIAEIITESKPVHYTKGGPLPTMVFPAIDFSGVDAATLKRKQDSELNNGRLAMIAIMSFISAANIPGSVPALTGNPAF